ncbi:Protein-tyrosine-phosphatase MKP1 [Ananas comosus]|uniref:Protein-tyrosine-phosphatase MKP1 n=1 Tax=Ananas comosus TaxID=4615 RepID=A0A199VCC2_ANACO|nr:Protein-tyrosine-phosphatase MKP1 [Ananas comosus]
MSDGADASTSGDNLTPRKSFWRSASWTARSSPTAPAPQPNPGRPPKRPGRLALPVRPPLSGWPRQASDDSGPTPSASGLAHTDAADLSRVADHVYLGSDAAARDRNALRRHGITHVLNCVGAACPDYFRGEGDLVYKTLWLHDSPAEDLSSVLYDAFDFLEDARGGGGGGGGGRALVHCVRGASRSAAIVVAYLMWRHAIPFDAALRRVKAARAAADPNLGFAAQLLRRQPRPGAANSPGSARRVLRLAPHSPCAPLHLVPKTALPSSSSSGASAAELLDSRGAFLVHVPAAVYVWLGAACEPAMAAAAARAAAQVVRYERVAGPVVTVREGAEPPDFWSAIAAEPSVPDPSKAGKRRVELYDLDFEIFHHALKSPNEEAAESTTPSSSSADSASTFSPASSSSSDWYNSPSTPGHSTIQLGPKLPSFRTRTENEKASTFPSDAADTKTRAQSLAERRGGITPSLVLLAPPDAEKEQPSPQEFQHDWCLSPAFIPDVEVDEEEEGDSMCIDHQLSLNPSNQLNLDAIEEDIEEEEGSSQLIHPILFRWPEMDKMEEIHPGVLDSRSVFLMVAPNSRKGVRKPTSKILYIWLGSGSELSEGDVEKVRDVCSSKTGIDVLDLIGIPPDTPVEIIKEGQEPEQFLNNLFSFHHCIESSYSGKC